ncbi:MAG: HEAT repeat domain-containing protein, partial [Pirellulales bacterium]
VNSGKILSVKTAQVLDLRGHDLRFRPDDGRMEVQSGQTQFGRNRDDWGNWFGCNNPNPGWHYVLADHYLKRNPHVRTPSTKVMLGENNNSYPCGRVITHCFYDQPTPPAGEPGRWTCICGTMIYRDELLGKNFAGNLFVSDSVYNCIHRKIVTPDGVTFRGRRAAEERHSEFLVSADPWFRPNTIQTGPDGALWFADMVRLVIEHPEWLDVRLIDKLDVRAGHDKGRIYRVYPINSKPRPIRRLDSLDAVGLVAALDSPNGWQRDMAQQLLVWRQERAAIEPLRKMVTESPRALARLQALCTLDGLDALSAELVVRALADRHPGVRRHAIRLSERLLAQHDEVGEALLKLAQDTDAQVRMQLAYSLGEWDDPRGARALGRLAVQAAGEPYLTAAVLSSASRNLPVLVNQILPEARFAESRAGLIRQLFPLALALDDESSLTLLLRSFTGQGASNYGNWQYTLMASALDDLARHKTSLPELHQQAGPQLREALGQTPPLFAAARKVAADTATATSDRVAAMVILGRGLAGRDEDLQTL